MKFKKQNNAIFCNVSERKQIYLINFLFDEARNKMNSIYYVKSKLRRFLMSDVSVYV